MKVSIILTYIVLRSVLLIHIKLNFIFYTKEMNTYNVLYGEIMILSTVANSILLFN